MHSNKTCSSDVSWAQFLEITLSKQEIICNFGLKYEICHKKVNVLYLNCVFLFVFNFLVNMIHLLHYTSFNENHLWIFNWNFNHFKILTSLNMLKSCSFFWRVSLTPSILFVRLGIVLTFVLIPWPTCWNCGDEFWDICLICYKCCNEFFYFSKTVLPITSHHNWKKHLPYFSYPKIGNKQGEIENFESLGDEMKLQKLQGLNWKF